MTEAVRLNTEISQGSAATDLGQGGTFNSSFLLGILERSSEGVTNGDHVCQIYYIDTEYAAWELTFTEGILKATIKSTRTLECLWRSAT